MKKVREIEVGLDEFKTIKTNRRVLSLQLGTNEMKGIETKDKVAFVTVGKRKKLKRKVKKIHNYSNLEEVSKNVPKSKLGLKGKGQVELSFLEAEFSKKDVEKYGLVGIEFARKITFMRILFVILCVVLACMLWFKLDGWLDKMNAEKVNARINELSRERVSYVFIEINPSMVFIMKGDSVASVACLNEDCMSMYDEMHVEGASLKEGIESVYSLAKNKGFDVSAGVTVKSSENVKLEGLDYVSVEYVNPNEEKVMLEGIQNNEEKVVQNDDEDYYAKLWDELKKDSKYGKVYDCAMNGDRLECHFVASTISPLEGILDGSSPVTKVMQIWLFTHLDDIGRTLDKFNIENDFLEDMTGDEVRSNTLYLNGIPFNYVLDYTHNELNIKNACYSRTQKRGTCYPEFNMCECTMEVKAFALADLDLLNPTSVLGKLQVDDSEPRMC